MTLKKFKNKDKTWNTDKINNIKSQLIDIIIDNTDWFFIPYKFWDDNLSTEEKFSNRSVIRSDLEKLDMLILLDIIEKMQRKHCELLGFNYDEMVKKK